MKPDWQTELSNTIKSLSQLEQVDELQSQVATFSTEAHEQFRTRFPLSFIQSENENSALLAQVIPVAEENDNHTGFVTDPVGDLDAMATPGLIHKYRNRALFIVTGACAIHCRYCFRRHYPYSDAQLNSENWQPALDYLSTHNEISEIILSGGDPLIVSDQKLEELLTALEKIPHLKRLRIHSRIPTVLPSRINDKLLSLLQGSRFKTVLVTHINHADELKTEHKIIFERLHHAGITLLNQSVLLAGVNNNAKVLRDLSEKLYGFGILPYYLHLLDPVKGAAHFFVKKADAIGLIEKVSSLLPGYLVPKLVQEIAGKAAKTRIA